MPVYDGKEKVKAHKLGAEGDLCTQYIYIKCILQHVKRLEELDSELLNNNSNKDTRANTVGSSAC